MNVLLAAVWAPQGVSDLQVAVKIRNTHAPKQRIGIANPSHCHGLAQLCIIAVSLPSHTLPIYIQIHQPPLLSPTSGSNHVFAQRLEARRR